MKPQDGAQCQPAMLIYVACFPNRQAPVSISPEPCLKDCVHCTDMSNTLGQRGICRAVRLACTCLGTVPSADASATQRWIFCQTLSGCKVPNMCSSTLQRGSSSQSFPCSMLCCFWMTFKNASGADQDQMPRILKVQLEP